MFFTYVKYHNLWSIIVIFVKTSTLQYWEWTFSWELLISSRGKSRSFCLIVDSKWGTVVNVIRGPLCYKVHFSLTSELSGPDRAKIKTSFDSSIFHQIVFQSYYSFIIFNIKIISNLLPDKVWAGILFKSLFSEGCFKARQKSP